MKLQTGGRWVLLTIAILIAMMAFGAWYAVQPTLPGGLASLSESATLSVATATPGSDDAASDPPPLASAGPVIRPAATVEPVVVEAPKEPVPDQVVIQFTADASLAEKQAYIESVGGTVDQQIDSINTVVVKVPKGKATQPLPESPVVQASEPDYIAVVLDSIALPPNDPRYDEQWALPAIGAPDAWSQLPVNAPTVTVAVIDSGICADHLDLAGRIDGGWDFLEDDAIPQDDYGHGCSVAGVIAANMNDGIGIAGVAPNAMVMPIRVLNASGSGTYSDVAAGIVYAADHGAQVINLSLGGTMPSSTLEKAVDYAVSKAVILVAAAGNSGAEGAMYPAAYESVIAVGSVDPNLQHSSFSNYGAHIDLWAPGRDILTTKRDEDYGLVSGTSFAAPHVAGAAALEIVWDHPLTVGGELVRVGSLQSEPTLDPTATHSPTAEFPTEIPNETDEPPSTPTPDLESFPVETLYIDPRYGYTLSIPEGWTVFPSDSEGIVTIALLCNYDPQAAEDKGIPIPADEICMRLGVGKFSDTETFADWVTLRRYVDTNPLGYDMAAATASSITDIILKDLSGTAFLVQDYVAERKILEMSFPSDSYVFHAEIFPSDSLSLSQAVNILSTLSFTPGDIDLGIPETTLTLSSGEAYTPWLAQSFDASTDQSKLLRALEASLPALNPQEVEALATCLAGTFPGSEASSSPIELWLPFKDGETWTVGGSGSFYGNGYHCNSYNDYYATDWNRTNDYGAEVLPVADGNVTNYNNSSPCPSTGYGCFVEVTHGSGVRTVYGHLSSVQRTSGETKHWETIGLVGSSGNSTSAHLHLAFRKLDGSTYYSHCNTIGGNGLCPNGESPAWPQSPRPSPVNTQGGSVTITDYGAYTSNNKYSGGGSCDATSLPSGYTKCQEEGGGRCSFSGTKTVYYGANSCYAVETKTDGVECNNDNFGGDPLPGVHKACYIEPSAPPSDDTVTIYENGDYTGTKYGWNDPGVFDLPDYVNDRASSIWIQSGWSARVFEHGGQGGGQRCYNDTEPISGDTYDTGGGVNDSVSSIEVYNQDICPPMNAVFLYERANLEGTHSSWNGAGTYNLDSSLNDLASSIRIQLGWSARVYEHADQGGGQRCYDSTDTDFGGDTFDNGLGVDGRVSSITLYAQESCPAIDAAPPTGQINAPANNSVIKTCPLTIEAQASDSGSGVSRVEFHANYDGGWHHLGDDTSSPYSWNWDCSSLNEQGVWLTIHVWDNAGNEVMDPGGYVYVTLDHKTVSAADVWTGDGNWNPKTTFNPGDSIKWIIAVNNTTGSDASVELTWNVRDPGGQQVASWTGTVTTSAGILSWGLPGTVPAIGGTYTFTGKVNYQGALTQDVTTYYVNPPPSTPASPSPVDYATVERTTDLALVWNTSGADQCYVRFWGGPSIDINSGWGSCSNWHIGSQWPGAYQWQVQARNSAGTTTGPTWHLNIRPYAPTNLTASGSSSTQVNLAWTASGDAPGNIDGYDIYKNGALLTSVGASATSYSATGLTCATTYSFEVRAKRQSVQSNSATASATTPDCPPSKGPALKKPANGYVATKKVTLSWTALRKAPKYEVQVDDNSDFSSPTVDKFVPKKASLKLPVLNFGQYYWRVRTQQSSGVWTGWSETRTLTFTALKSPKNGSRVKNHKPSFSWMRVPGASSYHLQVATDPNFTNVVLDVPHWTKLSYKFAKIATPLPSGLLYWRVRGVGSPLSNWTLPWSFTVP